jgi:hypothetical protein
LSNPSRLNWLEGKKNNKEPQQQEILARAAAYIFERGYIEPRDIPLLQRGLSSGDDDQAEKMIKKLLTRMSAQAGITDAKFISRLASLLIDHNYIERSFKAYLQTTPQYKKLIKDRKPAKDDADEDSMLTSARRLLFDDQFKKAIHFHLDIFGSGARLELQLTLPVTPDIANGKWNPKQRTIAWKGPLTSRDGKTTTLPEICYALWSEPNEKFQKARFGKTILSGKKLMDYCIWREVLSDDEAKLWDAVLMKHKPGTDLKAAVKTAIGSDKPMPYIKKGVDMLTNALREEEPRTQPAD